MRRTVQCASSRAVTGVENEARMRLLPPKKYERADPACSTNNGTTRFTTRSLGVLVTKITSALLLRLNIVVVRYYKAFHCHNETIPIRHLASRWYYCHLASRWYYYHLAFGRSLSNERNPNFKGQVQQREQVHLGRRPRYFSSHSCCGCVSLSKRKQQAPSLF